MQELLDEFISVVPGPVAPLRRGRIRPDHAEDYRRYFTATAVADGYAIINTNDAWLYTVSYADYYCGDGLRLKDLWDGREPHVFMEGQQIERFHPQLLGAISACWNDLTLHEYMEQDIHDMVVPTFGLMGQKTWNGRRGSPLVRRAYPFDH
jgi:hypothetical protein